MVRTGMWFIVGVVLLWAGIVQAGPNQLLNGDYAFTGEASCLTDLTPQDGGFVVSFSVDGVRTFNGDGTGTLQGRSVGVTHPDRVSITPPAFAILGGAFSSDFQASFTYDVASDGTFTTQVTGQLTGKELTGERAGQTFTIDHFPELSGQISQDHKSLTLASDAPTEEDAVEGDHSMTDLARLGLALVGFAVAVVAAGIVLGFIAARMAKARGRD